MIFVDSGFLVALYSPSDGLHDLARAWSRRTSGPLLVTDYVLVEAANALTSRALRTPALRMIDTIRASSQFQILAGSDGWLDPALDILRQKTDDKLWSLTDCTSFAVMKHYALIHALAHDRHFQEAGFVPLLRHDPETFQF